ncbi:MAG TPA: phosphoribosylglycinamide formyltransferase [Actinomycetota bacterium]|nr:phosphoribosylglycinamide formyltransferase [Actinomycetota bacterium]
MLRVGVLASGSGTNFQALADACATGYADAEIGVVLSNRPGAGALERAERAGIEAVYVDPARAVDRESYDRLLLDHLTKFEIDLVCAAGYMRLLSPVFVSAFEERILNVHPSLLPAFPGLDAVKQAWEWGVTVTGVTVHVIDAELDHGPIVLQASVDIRPDETLADIERRIHLTEYVLYPKALKLWASGAVRIDGRRVAIDQEVEDPPWAGDVPPGLRGEHI